MIHGKNSKKWFAKYFDWKGNYFGMVEATEPIDDRTKEAGMKK